MATGTPAVQECGRDGDAAALSAAGAHPTAKARDVGLSRRQRLLSPHLFEEAFADGKQWPTRTLVMWIRRAPDACGRVGVVASKRTFRRAVDRNRARRLLREAFRLNRYLLDPGVDVVLLARRRILSVKQAAVEQDLGKSCRDAAILRSREEGACRGS